MLKKSKVKNKFFSYKTLVSLLFFISLFGLSVYSTAGGWEPEKGFRVAQSSPRPNFNHNSTSFQLLGAHRGLECKQCHFGGRYKGTPRTCENCHNGQFSYGKPKGHLMSTQACSLCHTQNSWLPTVFTHDASTSGQCSICHNGQKATGKPSNHVNTNSQCDSCHKTTAWVPVGFNHSNLAGQLCSSCHKVGGSGLPPKSDTVHRNLNGQDCQSCHSSTTTFTSVTMNHSGIVASCSTCHSVGNSAGAVAKPSNHMATTQECNLCHAGTTTFANAVFNHLTLTGQLCSSCHKVGGSGMAPKNDVVHSNLNGQDCKSCHSSTMTFTTVTMNHTGIIASCSTCHYVGNSVGAAATPNPHPYAASNSDCRQCHTSFSTFAGASFNHTSVTTCKTCHYSGNATGAMPPPGTSGDLIHNPLSNIITDCNSCHTSTQSGGFSSYKMVHTAILNYSTTCQNCHKAGNPMGAEYKSNHNVGVICGNCHSTNTFDK